MKENLRTKNIKKIFLNYYKLRKKKKKKKKILFFNHPFSLFTFFIILFHFLFFLSSFPLFDHEFPSLTGESKGMNHRIQVAQSLLFRVYNFEGCAQVSCRLKGLRGRYLGAGTIYRGST